MILFSSVTYAANVGSTQTHLFSDLLQAMQITWQSLSVSHPFRDTCYISCRNPHSKQCLCQAYSKSTAVVATTVSASRFVCIFQISCSGSQNVAAVMFDVVMNPIKEIFDSADVIPLPAILSRLNFLCVIRNILSEGSAYLKAISKGGSELYFGDSFKISSLVLTSSPRLHA